MKVSMPNYPKTGSERKIKVQIDKWDTWSLDHTLAHIIHPALIQLRDTTHGYPGHDGMTAAKWTKILNQMIWSFGELAKDNSDDQFYTGEIVWGEPIKLPDGNFQYKTDKKKSTFKCDRRGLNAHHKKIQAGVELFGRYYRDLWD